jgi:transposase
VDELTREELISIILELQERVAFLEQENAELRDRLGMGGAVGSPKPEWVKPNRAERREQERAERKKRKHAFTRKREIRTREVRHAVEVCPDCGRKLAGGWEHSRHQVMEIPEAPIEIIEHVLVGRRCGICGKNHIPRLSASDGVIGKQRVGVRLMSLIAMLATAKRMPLRAIQKLLDGLYGLHISLGEITELLHKVGRCAEGTAKWILREIRGSPYAHGDETGWREDGINGYLWSLSTPELRYYHFERSRAGAVAEKLFGACFSGVLLCDFYGGYNWYSGPIQRCWPHFLRALTKLMENHPDDESVRKWVESIKDLYKIAKKIARRGLSERARVRFRQELESRLLLIAEPYLIDDGSPQNTLAKRIERHLGELFTFVQYPGCPSGNNAAERAIRPAVIIRKISGGTRSANGSKTRTTLMSVFGTWTLQGKDLLTACTNMIIAAQSSLPLPAT